ncbi:MAG: hypothetical protein ABR577_14080 [Pyrinomonadaceae bacterium]
MSTTEPNAVAVDSSRRTIFIIVGGIGIVLFAGLFYLMSRPDRSGAGVGTLRLEGALRAGSPDFEKYVGLVKVDAPEATEGTRAIGDIVMTLTTTVRNFSGRTISGLEMRAAVVDLAGKPVKERTVIVIPGRQPALEPNKTINVPVMLEGFSKTDTRANIKMEVTGLLFK